MGGPPGKARTLRHQVCAHTSPETAPVLWDPGLEQQRELSSVACASPTGRMAVPARRASPAKCRRHRAAADCLYSSYLSVIGGGPSEDHEARLSITCPIGSASRALTAFATTLLDRPPPTRGGPPAERTGSSLATEWGAARSGTTRRAHTRPGRARRRGPGRLPTTRRAVEGRGRVCGLAHSPVSFPAS